MNGIKIRRATIEDVGAISAIKIEGWQTAYKKIINEEYLKNMSIEKIIEKNKNNFERYPFIVAESNNEIVGFCSYNFEKTEENSDCELRGIYVKSNMKRCGIGKKLINYVKREFRKANKQKMILWCFKENYPSRKFYEARGGIEGQIKNIEIGGTEYEIISYLFNLKKDI